MWLSSLLASAARAHSLLLSIEIQDIFVYIYLYVPYVNPFMRMRHC